MRETGRNKGIYTEREKKREAPVNENERGRE